MDYTSKAGATLIKNTATFLLDSYKDDCKVVLYDAVTGCEKQKIPFQNGKCIGNRHILSVKYINDGELAYSFEVDGKIVADEKARLYNMPAFGTNLAKTDVKAKLIASDFNWGADKAPKLPYHQVLFYELHVRGFSASPSSKMKEKGTFAGLTKKLPYLQELGVTSVILQPAYEFIEMEDFSASMRLCTGIEKLNYWGYKEGFYYAPKASYAYTDRADIEFKEMIKAFHEKNMEVIMQFFFPDGMNKNEISSILEFWAEEYHVDGFVLMGNGLPLDLLVTNPLLAHKKLILSYVDESWIPSDAVLAYKNVAVLNESGLYAYRKFLKGDEGTLDEVLSHMRQVPLTHACINYMSHFQGFTLMDSVSYDFKHNEKNGEDNRDGLDHNFTWNCGEEGPTKKKKIMSLRQKQIKNAFLMLMLSAGTPLIFMGDEFGNSQAGNNNPYCIDDETTWLDWSLVKKNKSILDAFKETVALRHSFALFHPANRYRMMDYMACGYPDVSYHGEMAWKVATEYQNRTVGILYCGKYDEKAKVEKQYYLAMNMYWDTKPLALPDLPKGETWEKVLSTEVTKAGEVTEKGILVPGRTIELYVSTGKIRKNTKQKNDRTAF